MSLPSSRIIESVDGLFAEAFCSYCGLPPEAGPSGPEQRVCRRCAFGMVLGTTPNGAPRHDDPFVIVDRLMRLQAMSREAETLLGVEELAALGVPLDEFLVSVNRDPDDAELARLVARTTYGVGRPALIALRTVNDPLLRFQARITSCGPPLAALVVLAGFGDRVGASSNETAPDVTDGKVSHLGAGNGAR